MLFKRTQLSNIILKHFFINNMLLPDALGLLNMYILFINFMLISPIATLRREGWKEVNAQSEGFPVKCYLKNKHTGVKVTSGKSNAVGFKIRIRSLGRQILLSIFQLLRSRV